MKKILSLAIFSLTIFGCVDKTVDRKNHVCFKETKQVPIFDNASSNINIYAPDTVTVGLEYCAKIRLTNSQQKIINAYAQCDFAKSLVDTTLQTLDNCSIKLLVTGDTAFFCVTPNIISDNLIYKIAILTKDNSNMFHLDTLDLIVISKKKTYP